jgi:excisionase family DNA binding protein
LRTMELVEKGQRLLTVREAAERMRVSPQTYYRLVAANVAPAIRVGKPHSGRLMVPADELERWLFDYAEEAFSDAEG